jgi:hypothetical protein
LTKIILRKITSPIFLAIVLVVGTFTAVFPTFITGVNAQSESYYEMDKDRKQVSVSSLKCNNINVNVNGLSLDVFPPFLGGDSGLAAEAAEGNTDPSSIAGNGDSSQINDFRFICINNNNNTVIEEEEPETCEECFKKFLTPEQFDEAFEEIIAFCQDADEGAIFNETLFRLGLAELGVDDIGGLVDRLIECLEDAGVEFEEGPPI